MSYSLALEDRHKHSPITRYFHNFRYKKVVQYIRQAEKDLGRAPKVMDIGCSKGNVYFAIKEYCNLEYIGVELKEDMAAQGNENMKDEPNAKILNRDASELELYEQNKPDIVMALESFEHIPSGGVFRIIETVAKYDNLHLFMASVPVEVGPAIWIKNIGSALIGYGRHKEYSASDTFWSGLYQLDKVPRHDCRHKGFDWRWLAQTIRLHLWIVKVHKSPYDFVPSCLTPTILFVAKKD